MSFIPASLLSGLFLSNRFEVDDSRRKTGLELLSISADNGPCDCDGGEQAVGGGCYGGEFRVVGTYAFDGVHFDVDDLAWPEFGDEDVGVCRRNCVGAREVVCLSAERVEGYVFGVYTVYSKSASHLGKKEGERAIGLTARYDKASLDLSPPSPHPRFAYTLSSDAI